MRIVSRAGLALAAVFASASASACDFVLQPDQRDIYDPGKYCLFADRELPIEIRSDNVELDCRGRLLGNGAGSSWDTAITVSPRRGVTVRNCRIEGWPRGVYVDRASDTQIVNNTVLRPQSAGLLVQGNDSPEGDGVRLIGNRIANYGNQGALQPVVAIRLQGANHLEAVNNVVAGFGGEGVVHVEHSADVRLTGNQVLDFESGVGSAFYLDRYSPRTRLVHNTVTALRPYNVRGIEGEGVGNATCIENVFVNTTPSNLALCAAKRNNLEQISQPVP
ncbi:right-handed parallel beta-helix repeat-containing protein [Lysobacter sp. BMK333-48F3]|uniref:right-handed parallel beta-helix repeat-containing protein n=1 Tax=Lysobacter sp. BMK333-48F3 TaxID=2867962 RepID=UPI001C8BC593|nr:right-handed parallel beta-helix repeat-containing protein [Lysobacter sp. BMK333-48F3]MBX9403311.1 right-handed parallel beta-helix repeat-containing protein [Lysobacter sp. BMK333-48F3]